MLRIFLNADDFGLSAGVNAAVVELAGRGALSSTTVMMNQPFAEEAGKLMDFPGFGIGLHVNLTQGRPLSPPERVPSIVGADGCFLGQKAFRSREKKGQVSEAEVLCEIEAQYAALQALVGDRLTHLDSHQNVHKARTVARAFLAFGKKHPGLGCRAPARYFLRVTQERRAPAFADRATADRSAAGNTGDRDRLNRLRSKSFDGQEAGLRQPSGSFRIEPAWRYHLLRGQLRRALTELYLLRLTRRLRAAFWTPVGELYPPSLKKLELLETLFGAPMADGGAPMADGGAPMADERSEGRGQRSESGGQRAEGIFLPSDFCPLNSSAYEIACHPATHTEGLGESALTDKRVREYEVLIGDGGWMMADG